MRIASIGSGSGGNGTLIAAGGALFLIDCGFGLKEARARLARRGVAPERLSAILVTHEHGDHAGGVTALAHRFEKPVHLSHGTLRALPRLDASLARPFDSGATFSLGDVQVAAVPVPHDAREPTQFVFRRGAAQVGILTDLGAITDHVRERYRGCTALFLESNHDRGMLLRGGDPPHLKRRIAGGLGHLSNEQAAGFLGEMMHDGLRQVVVGHVSARNNSPAHLDAAFAPFRGRLSTFCLASQHDGLDWLDVG